MASLGAYDVAEFEAGVRVLLLMIYDPEIFNSYDRYKTYTKKVDVFIERYTTLEAAKIDT
jgi:voltage-gated potassium channel Kch